MAETDPNAGVKLADKYDDQPALEKGYRELRGAMELAVPEEGKPLVGADAPFRDVKSLESAYKELSTLQRRIPSKKPDAPKPDDKPAPKADEGSPLRVRPVGEPTGDDEANLQTIETVLSKAGLKSEDVVKQWTDNGSLDPDTYKAFGRAGWKKEAVDSFIAGQHAIVQLAQIRRDTAVKAAETKVGGKEQLNTILAWAAVNVPKNTLDALGAKLDKDDSYYPEYVDGLAQLYTAKNGASGRIIEGGGGGGVGGPKTFADLRALTAKADRGDAAAQRAIINMTEDQIKALK